MPRKFVFTAIVLIALTIVAISGSALSAKAQAPQPLTNSGGMPDSLSPVSPVTSAELPVSLPEAAPADGILVDTPAADDRDSTAITPWLVMVHQTPQQVADTIALGSGYRLVDIDVEASSPNHLFTAVYVANYGYYAKSWWWYYGVDEATLNTALIDNNARLISLKAYDIGSGQIRFTAVMISNTGADAAGWWWYYNLTPTQINDLIVANEARLTQIQAYQTNGQTRYAVVMVDNAGSNERGWLWYYNATPAYIADQLQANQARLVDMDKDPVTGNLNVVMNTCESGCPYWWWYYGISQDQILDVVNQNGARIIDINSYPGCGSTCYDFILINNSNAITTRVGEMLRGGTDGVKGLYLEQLDGGILANLMNYYSFEPASTLKVAPHLYTIQQVQDDPSVSLSTLISQYEALPEGESCPTNTVIGTESIDTADREMMWRSNNVTTRELVDHFGVTDINNMMTSLGMNDSSINHVFGCGGPTPNETTLDDLATLYKTVASGTILDATHQQLFYSQMAGTAQFNDVGYDWTHLVDTDIPAIIDQEAPSEMPATLKDNFEDGINLAYKAGGYQICTSAGCATYDYHISVFGYAEIPFCDAGGTREYVFGLFIYNASSKENAEDTFDATRAELLREQIHDGLASCFNQVYLPLTSR